MKEFLEIIVESKTALSIEVFEPILQLLPIKTLPIWFIVILDFGSNPKPAPPITAPDLIIQLDPIIQFCKLELEFIIWDLTSSYSTFRMYMRCLTLFDQPLRETGAMFSLESLCFCVSGWGLFSVPFYNAGKVIVGQ